MDKLNQWLSLLGNIGVLAGILFLVIEIQQNTNMMQAQTRDAMTDKQMKLFTDIATDQYSADILAIGNASASSLTQMDNAEATSYILLVQSNLRMWENEFYQYQMGLFDEEEFEPRRRAWKDVIGFSPGYIQVWQMRKEQYSPEFRMELEKIIED